MKGNRQDYDQNDKQEENLSQDQTGKVDRSHQNKKMSLKEQVLSSIHQGEPVEDIKYEKRSLYTSKDLDTEDPFKYSSRDTDTGKQENKFDQARVSTLNEEPKKEDPFFSRTSFHEEKHLDEDKIRTRKKEDKLVRKIVQGIVVVLVICIVVLGISFYRYWQNGLKPLDPSNEKLVQVEIPIGSSNKQIGQILQDKDVIKSGFVFTYFVKMNNLSNFQAGFYQMSPNMTLKSIAGMLQQGGTAEPEALADAKLVIPEGYTVDQIGDLIEKQTQFSKAEFLEFMQDQDFFNQMVEKYPELLTSAGEAQDVRYRLEGYLFPATYNYYKKQTLAHIVEPMIKKMDAIMASRYAEITNKGLSVQESLTLASLVEKEGVSQEDRRNIAQVFFNRIQENMPLQSDISVLYALNEQKVHLSNKDTQVDSPYNLYIHEGYGPGPFDNPSESAIDAVLNPTPNEYLYFLADITDHKVYFAKTYEEHLEQKQKYIESKK